MKTGIVFEIKNYQAVIMKSNGEFVTIPAKREWKKGDVVIIENNKINLKSLYAIAVCFLIFISFTSYGISTYYNETSIISLDINPSIELRLNCYDKVIAIDVLNDEGRKVVQEIDVKNKNYDKAIELLLENENYNIYIKDNPNVVFTVSTKNVKKEEDLLSAIQSIADEIIYSKHGAANIEYYTVDNQIVEDAHHYGVTAGKYMTLLQLQEEVPNINIQDYTHCSITEIKTTITQHHSSSNHNSETKYNNNEIDTPIEHSEDTTKVHTGDTNQEHDAVNNNIKIETENHKSNTNNHNKKESHSSKKSH